MNAVGTDAMRKMLLQMHAEGTLGYDGRIPGIRILAKALRRAPATLHKNLRQLLGDGLVTQDEKSRRFYLVESARLSSEGGPVLSLSLKLYQRIAKDLIGRLDIWAPNPGDSLPSLKSMANRAHCSRDTLSRALHQIARQGLIVRDGSGWKRPFPEIRNVRESSVILFVHPNVILSPTSHFQEFCAALDESLAGLGWPGARAIPTTTLSHRHVGFRNVAGFIFFPHSMDKAWSRFFAAYPKIPLVVIDPSQSAPRLRHHRMSYRIFSDNVDNGHRLARHMLDIGAKPSKVAVFSHLGWKAQWVQRRLLGIRSCLKERLNPKYIFETAPQEKAHDNSELELRWRGGKDHAAMSSMGPYRQRVESVLRLLFPCFERALTDGANFWIGINDEVAAAAHIFCEASGKKPGTDIAIAGFDNSPMAACLELTSLDPGLTSLARLAAKTLVDPGKLPFDKKGVLAAPGRLVVRGSTYGPWSRNRSQ